MKYMKSTISVPLPSSILLMNLNKMWNFLGLHNMKMSSYYVSIKCFIKFVESCRNFSLSLSHLILSCAAAPAAHSLNNKSLGKNQHKSNSKALSGHSLHL